MRITFKIIKKKIMNINLLTDVTHSCSQTIGAKLCLERKKIQSYFFVPSASFAPCERGCVTPVIKPIEWQEAMV